MATTLNEGPREAWQFEGGTRVRFRGRTQYYQTTFREKRTGRVVQVPTLPGAWRVMGNRTFTSVRDIYNHPATLPCV